MSPARLRLVPVLGLLALVPVALFAAGRLALAAGALSAISVALIALSLFLMFSPAEGEAAAPIGG